MVYAVMDVIICAIYVLYHDTKYDQQYVQSYPKFKSGHMIFT